MITIDEDTLHFDGLPVATLKTDFLSGGGKEILNEKIDNLNKHKIVAERYRQMLLTLKNWAHEGTITNNLLLTFLQDEDL